MPVQGTDKIAASRMGIVGKVSAQEIAEIPTPVSTHTDVDVTPSGNSKEVLTNNGGDIYENRTLQLDDLDDVSTLAVTPQAGWILKHNGTEFIPAMKAIYSNKPIIVNTQTNFGNGTVMQPVIPFPRAGIYSLTFSCNYSIDATGSDILMEAQMNGALSVITDSLLLRLEAKDATGNDLDGRGTTQKYAFSQKLYTQVFGAGNLQLLWRIRPEANNVEAAVWEASLTIEEEFGIINI